MRDKDGVGCLPVEHACENERQAYDPLTKMFSGCAKIRVKDAM